MIKMKLFEACLVHKVPFMIISVSLIIGLLILQPQQTLTLIGSEDSSAIALASPFLKWAFADHGQEITISLHNSSFGSLTSGGGNQVSVFASYELNDNSIAGKIINAVMEVYVPNGTLVRTSSYPNGFVAHTSGGVEGLETTIKDPTVQSVLANVTFRNLDKTETLSNELRVESNIGEEGTAPTATGQDVVGGEKVPGFELEQDTSPPLQTDQQGDGEEEETGDDEEGESEDENDVELPLPFFGNR
jgi:hypothetical protein